MFAAKVKEQAREGSIPTKQSASELSAPAARPFDPSVVEQTHSVQRSTSDALNATLGALWNLGNIGVLATHQTLLSPTALPLRHVTQPKLIVGSVSDTLENDADRVADEIVDNGAPEAKNLDNKKRAPRVTPAGTSAPAGLAPDTVHEALRAPGRQLDSATRGFMEARFDRDFSNVRIHDDPGAAKSASAVNARAYTAGEHVVFAQGQFQPGTRAGSRLLAHELAHVAQNGASGTTNVIARKADPNAVAQMDVATIRADPDYIENGLVKMTFYGAEEADLYYSDGAVLHIGLVQRWIKPPFESVDYHTARAEYAAYQKSPRDLKFIPNVRKLDVPPGTTYAEVLEKHAKSVTFSVETQSGKIVPNHVNPVTAPYLCSFLQKAETEYIQNFDAVAKGMVKILQAVKMVLEIELFRRTIPTGGAPAAAEKAFDAGRLAEQLYAETKALQNPGRMMLRAATKLSGMGELSAAQKSSVILEFFKRIGFAISKEGLKDTGEFFVMKSEDSQYAFRFIKATGKIVYGKFDMKALDYIWTEL